MHEQFCSYVHPCKYGSFLVQTQKLKDTHLPVMSDFDETLQGIFASEYFEVYRSFIILNVKIKIS